MSDTSLHFELVSSQDGQQILKWRNDPKTRQSSFHHAEKHWKSFEAEFCAYFNFPDLPPLFIVKQSQRVGFLRFYPCQDPLHANRKCCAVSIYIAKEHRHQGFGKAALIDIAPWIQNQGYDDIYAEVLKTNAHSLQLFLQAGYCHLPADEKIVLDTGEKMAIYRLLKQLTNTEIEKKPFIIAEAGSNWRMGTKWRDLAMAKTLIDIAKEAGADAVKFQLFHPEALYAPNAGQSAYLAEKGITAEMDELFSDLVLSSEMVQKLVDYAKVTGIEFMATPFSVKDFETIHPFVQRHKIASYELAHVHLLKRAAQSGKPLYLSTGCATEEEIAWSVNFFRAQAGKNLCLLQCTAAYPAPSSAMNLKAIAWLKQRFRVEVGLSDHSRHPTAAPVTAIAFGATAIEKHFTLDNALPGPDHAFALLPHELKEMVTAVHTAFDMQGCPVKIVAKEELELRNFARRGIQATVPIAKGDLFQEGQNIAILRPGRQQLGVHPLFLEEIHGKSAQHAIDIGRGIQFEDFRVPGQA